MTTGYLIEKYNNMGSAYTCARLLEEAKVIGMSLDIVGIHDTIIRESVLENCGKILEPRDFVINRYKWGHIKDAINNLAQKSYNRIECYRPYIDKYVQLHNLASQHFDKPKYILGTAQSNFEQLVSLLGMPFIAKGLDSSMGREIRLIKNASELSSLAKEFSPEKEFLFEEFITSSYGRDLRLFSIRGEAVACMIRESKTDFRANVALGANVKNYPINSELQSIATDIYEVTGLDVLGIDLLFGRESLFFCEINVMPGLEGIEYASGINIARLALRRIKEDFN